MLDDTRDRKPSGDKRPENNVSSQGGDDYEELQKAKRSSLFGRMNQAFQDALQSSRGTSRTRVPAQETVDSPNVQADDVAIRRARSAKPQRLIVPEGVIIDGSLTSSAETEIAGRIDGDVTVNGHLVLEPSALVSGNVRAAACRVDGLVEGRVECTQEVDLGETGRLNADVVAGKRISVGGQVVGNISSGGLVRLTATSKVTGDIRARAIVIDEGALFNGACVMRPPSQRTE